MTTPLLCSSLHGWMGVARLPGLDGKVARRVGRGAPLFIGFPSLFVAPSGRATSFTRGDQACPPFPAFSCPCFFLRAKRWS